MNQPRKRASRKTSAQAQPTQGAPDKNRARGRSALVLFLSLLMLPLMGAAGEIGFWLVVKLYALVLVAVVIYFFIRAYLRDRAMQKRNSKYYQ